MLASHSAANRAGEGRSGFYFDRTASCSELGLWPAFATMAAQPSAASRRAGTCISAPGAERLAANKTGPEGESGDLRLEFFYQPRQAGEFSCLSRASVTGSCFIFRSVLYSLRNIVNTHTTECSRGRKHLTVARGGKHADKLCGPWQFHAVQSND
jgi:hypothetical protein